LNSKPYWAEDVLLAVNAILSGVIMYGVVRYLMSSATPELVAMRTTAVVYGICLAAYLVIARGLAIGHVQGNGVLVTPELFPELHDTVVRQSRMLGLNRPPKVYIIQGGGLLNAFATKTLAHSYVVLYADIVETAYEEGSDVVDFVVAHELTHVRRRHVLKMSLTLPAAIVFPLRLAYSRACEFTCDRFATSLSPSGMEKALLLLAVGKKLYERVNPSAYVQTLESDRGLWKLVAEFLSTHPILSRRIRQATSARRPAETAALA
jgi:Zn-dependent protease with chaperone function